MTSIGKKSVCLRISNKNPGIYFDSTSVGPTSSSELVTVAVMVGSPDCCIVGCVLHRWSEGWMELTSLGSVGSPKVLSQEKERVNVKGSD